MTRDDGGRNAEGGRRDEARGAGGAGDDVGSVDWIRRRDEILEVLFWLEGEGFGDEMTVGTVARFLTWSETDAREALDRLVEEDFTERVEGGTEGEARYRLSHDGRQEGGRRFVEDFATILSRDTHGGACDDPDCACHYEGAAACENRASGGIR